MVYSLNDYSALSQCTIIVHYMGDIVFFVANDYSFHRMFETFVGLELFLTIVPQWPGKLTTVIIYYDNYDNLL